MKRQQVILALATVITGATILILAFYVFPEYRNQNLLIDSGDLIIDIKYPLTGQTAIDNDIKAFINENVRKVKQLPPSPANDPRNWKNELYITYDKPYINPKYVSLVFYVMVYSGGAHPNTIVVTKNYDKRTGRQLRLSDIISTGKEQLRAMIKSKLYQSLDQPNVKWVRQGVDASDLETFSFNLFSITFYFSQYEVAPYANGIQKVNFSLKALQPD
ncbi:MAG: DUF3298 and DUF4163 domain-containing protein [Candidatus Saganbacteria bacterium]|nr:DUF3298 and DUF4163 domain-containing protein [Candidatus Saganbacteria bacterium]